MPIYKMSSQERRERKVRQFVLWAKWIAVVLSVTLLATTLMLVHARHRLVSGNTATPATVELGKPLTAR